MSLDELTQAGLIHEFEDVSAGPHSSKFCFVLGAGASKTSGIKTGQEYTLCGFCLMQVYKNVPTRYNKYRLKKECEEHNYG